MRAARKESLGRSRRIRSIQKYCRRRFCLLFGFVGLFVKQCIHRQGPSRGSCGEIIKINMNRFCFCFLIQRTVAFAFIGGCDPTGVITEVPQGLTSTTAFHKNTH
jgi:hypothetical protein